MLLLLLAACFDGPSHQNKTMITTYLQLFTENVLHNQFSLFFLHLCVKNQVCEYTLKALNAFTQLVTSNANKSGQLSGECQQSILHTA